MNQLIRILFFCFLFSTVSQAQYPELPVINYLSVNPETNFIDIYWQKSPSPKIKNYLINLWITSIYSINIDSTQNADSTHFTIKEDVHPENKAESIIILAQDSLLYRSPLTNFHTSVHLDAVYDTCKYQAQLIWNAYFGWTSVDAYEIYLSKDKGAYSLLQTLPGTTLSYIHPHSVDTAEYCYYIAALRKDGVRSKSNKVCIQAIRNISNLNIILSSIKPSADQSQWNFSCHIDQPVNYLSYFVERSTNAYDSFDSLQSFPAPAQQIRFSDALQTKTEYFYKVSSMKQDCKEIYGVPAVIKPLTETAEKSGTTGYAIAWNYYPAADYTLNSFTVFVETPSSIRKALTTTMNSQYTVNTESELSEFANAAQICFFVEADMNYKTDTFRTTLISNSICFQIETEINVPDAFTPNSDGKNDIITPRFNRIPLNYVFIVYDRWGRETFESHSYTEGWDGRASGGKATEGVYTYVIKGTGFNGKNFEKVGYFSLIYP